MSRCLHSSRVACAKFRNGRRTDTGSGILLYLRPKPCPQFRSRRNRHPWVLSLESGQGSTGDMRRGDLIDHRISADLVSKHMRTEPGPPDAVSFPESWRWRLRLVLSLPVSGLTTIELAPRMTKPTSSLKLEH